MILSLYSFLFRKDILQYEKYIDTREWYEKNGEEISNSNRIEDKTELEIAISTVIYLSMFKKYDVNRILVYVL